MSTITKSNNVSTSPSVFPAQAVATSIKERPEWGQSCMDFFDYQSSLQSQEKYEIWRNYRIASGDMDLRDYQYYTDPLSLGPKKDELYGTTFDIVHFPIMNTPIQSILGERIKRPLNYAVMNLSSKARNEQTRIKTEMLRGYVMEQIEQRVTARIKQSGVDPRSEQGQQMHQQFTPEAIQEYMDKDYIDTAEMAGMKIVNAVYKDNALDDEFVDGFKHAVISAREFYHINVCGGKIKIRNLSPLDVFYQRSSNVKWISDAQYAGFRWYLTPASVLDLFYDDLTLEDMKDIEGYTNPGLGNTMSVGSGSGINSIRYDTSTYSDFFGNVREHNTDQLSEMINSFQMYGDRSNFFNTYGLIKVVKAYWKSYRKVGFLTYYDENDQPQKTLVDDNYVANKQLGEHISWKVINQVYEGGKIGDRKYLPSKPYKDAIFDIEDLDYCPLPIEGCTYNDTHTKPISMVDLMKPLNELYDIVALELKKDMNSSLGKVMFMSVDHIPDIPGFTWEKWYYWAKELKIAWVKQPPRGGNTFNQFSSADMSFAQQIMAKMDVMSRLKAECEAFGGFTQARIGQPTAPTAEQNTQSIQASVNQTEYWFFKHYKLAERILNFILRLARHVVREYNTYDYLFDDMELAYMKAAINGFGSDRLRLFVSSSHDDLQNRQKLESLLNLAVSNGADVMDAGDILLAKTISETRATFQSLRRKQKEAQKAKEQHELQLQQMQNQEKQEQRDWEKEEHYSTLENNLQQRYIQTFGFQRDGNMNDNNADGTADILQYDKVHLDYQIKDRHQRLQERKQFSDEVIRNKELSLKDEEIKVKREEIQADKFIATRNRNKYDK